MSAIDCMPRGLTYDAGLTGCKSAYKLLTTLAVFNVWSAALSVVLGILQSLRSNLKEKLLTQYSPGHIWIRQISPTCKRSTEWSAWSSIFLTTLHPASMVIATITIRVHGFYPSVFLTFAIWTMRPRMFGPLLWWLVACCFQRTADNAYLWTFKDSVIEESLLNVLSLPFATFLAVAHHFVKGDPCAGDVQYQRFWLSFYIIIAAGVISAGLLLYMAIHFCTRYSKPRIQQPRLGRFWKLTLTVGGLNMLLAFVGQWLLWGSKCGHERYLLQAIES